MATRAALDPQKFLAALPLFKALPAAALARLAQATTRLALRRGERVFSQGDSPTGLYVVVYGAVRLVARSATRGDRLTGVARAGRSFGEPVMFLQRPALVDAEAAEDTLLLHLPTQAVFDEIERSPVFARRVIAGLAQRIEAMVAEADRRAASSGRARLADYLLRNAPHRDEPSAFTLPAAKAAIAAHLDLTAEHFSRLLHELAADGLVQVRGRTVSVLQPQRLAAAARAVA